ncbi:IS200/IS605 family transposase [Streptomyces sp. NPDC055089]
MSDRVVESYGEHQHDRNRSRFTRRSDHISQLSEAEMRVFNGEGGHVHLPVHCQPEVQLSKPVNSLNGVSSRYLRQEFTDRTNRAVVHGRFRFPSSFAGSCGPAPLSSVKHHIEQQKRLL